jgi:polyisoprenoid-binding protein YceI
MIRNSLITAVIVLCTAAFASADTYSIDATHSSVGFSVRHMAISKVRGTFGEFEGTVNIDPADTAKWSCDVIIQTTSIDTQAERRDNHLRSADFFNVEEFPTITFKSTKVTPKGKDKLEITGDFTMRGVTKPVTIEAELLGAMEDARGNKRMGFSATTTVNRMDFGVNWNKTLETGGLVVSHDVEIMLEIEAIWEKPEESTE